MFSSHFLTLLFYQVCLFFLFFFFVLLQLCLLDICTPPTRQLEIRPELMVDGDRRPAYLSFVRIRGASLKSFVASPRFFSQHRSFVTCGRRRRQWWCCQPRTYRQKRWRWCAKPVGRISTARQFYDVLWKDASVRSVVRETTGKRIIICSDFFSLWDWLFVWSSYVNVCFLHIRLIIAAQRVTTGFTQTQTNTKMNRS